MTEKEFNNSLMKAVQFSQATSKIASGKAGNKNVQEFAGFELEETTVITSVLKDLGTIIPEMDEEAKISFNEIESCEPGKAFDELYIRAQLKNHRLLRDLTEDYLKEAPTGNLDKEETHGKHLAMLALTVFNEHVAITERINKELTNEVNG